MDIEFRIVHSSSKSATAVWGLGFMPHMVYDSYVNSTYFRMAFAPIPEDDSCSLHQSCTPPLPLGPPWAPPLKCYGEHVTVAIWLKNLHPVRVVLMALMAELDVALSCGGFPAQG